MATRYMRLQRPLPFFGVRQALRRRLGVYRFLPLFFLLGGGIEWFMINVKGGKETFYDVYRRKQSERQYNSLHEPQTR
uniref:ubiquinol-cytochrome c reductase complex assembly factor 5 n=1 Tax=Myxine glutinosa TaxID=7769 RepID=UPI00358DF674